jgi:hypothetical protein
MALLKTSSAHIPMTAIPNTHTQIQVKWICDWTRNYAHKWRYRSKWTVGCLDMNLATPSTHFRAREERSAWRYPCSGLDSTPMTCNRGPKSPNWRLNNNTIAIFIKMTITFHRFIGNLSYSFWVPGRDVVDSTLPRSYHDWNIPYSWYELPLLSTAMMTLKSTMFQ